jgi:hypothetical protein
MKTLILLLLLLSTSPLTHSHTHSLTHPLPIQHESSETTPTPTAKRRTPLTPSLLHLVITRFQQYQPTLLSLGHARIHLFRSFCLPSMRAQTSQHFVWLILTDPSLHSSLRVEMQQLLAPYPHFFLLPHLGFVTSELFINGDMRGHELWSGSRTCGEVSLYQRSRFRCIYTLVWMRMMDCIGTSWDDYRPTQCNRSSLYIVTIDQEVSLLE